MTKEQFEILDHTANRAAGGRFCGGSDAMNELVADGLMQSIGKASWCPDEFYAMTVKGAAAYSVEKASRQKVVEVPAE